MASRPLVPSGAPARRWSGIVLLIAAALLVVTTSTLLNRGITGLAAATALPSPPPVGSCLDLTTTSADVVSCAEPHDGEVLLTWPAGRLPDGVSAFDAVVAYPFGAGGQVKTAGCSVAQEEWVHPADLPGTAFWNPTSPVVDSQLIAAPPGERTAREGWVACVLVAPDRRPIVGSLRGGGPDAAPPSRLGSCLQEATNAWGAVTLTCDRPHRVEILASFRIRAVFNEAQRFTGMPTDATLDAACTALAAAVTGSDDPTFGGRLRVRATTLFPASVREINAMDPAGNPIRTYIPLPQCAVDLVGDGSLTGTVVGLGERPLPLG